MLIDLRNFLHSFCRNAVVRAAAQAPALSILYRPTDGTPRNLWRGDAIEDLPGTVSPNCADPFAVARIYRQDNDRNNIEREASIQLKVKGSGNDAAWGLIAGLYEAFVLDAAGREIRQMLINGYKAADDSADGTWQIVSICTIQGPGQIGRDAETGRVVLVANFDVGFYKAS